METLTTVAINTIGPVVTVLESYSWIGVSTHFVKHAVLVSELFSFISCRFYAVLIDVRFACDLFNFPIY